MNFDNRKSHKPPKDRDLNTITYFIRVAGLAVPFLCLLGLYIGFTHWGMTGALSGIAVAAVSGLIISVIVMYVMDAVSGAASGLLSGRREAVWTTREQVQGFLSQARFNKENNDFETAHVYVNKVLEKDPEFADALFLKAQLLWEGFGRPDKALQFLEKILSLENENPIVINQARLLHSDLSILESPADSMVLPEGIDVGLQSHASSVMQKLSHESLQNLKERAEETPMALWAIYTSIVFGLFLACVLFSMSGQIRELDMASSRTERSIETTLSISEIHAEGLNRVEGSIKRMNSQMSAVEKKLKRRK